jgi:hypothetical protein
MLTTSEEHEDIRKMYRLNCNSDITKPVNRENFIQLIKQSRATGSLLSFCHTTSELNWTRFGKELQ